MNKVGRISRAVKTAVSLPAETYHRAEALRRKNGSSRSELYATALRAYLGLLEVRELEARYVAGYKAHPEEETEMEALLKASLPALGKEVW